MADDPIRDILPVKDGSCYGSARFNNEIDPRERHMVCKLDRYQLENKYLKLLDEVNDLKKLTNQQEDKLKRLATKLIRSAATSRSSTSGFKVQDENDKIASLELENARLKDKANVLKNQLLSHRGPRSPSRCRRIPSGTFSGPTQVEVHFSIFLFEKFTQERTKFTNVRIFDRTHRSDSGRAKLPYHSQPRNGIDDNDAQNYLVKIQELESQRNGMLTRIADLEGQLAVHVEGAQREKVQDNVEYIRMWRQMKRTNDELMSVQALNDALQGQVANLKKLFEETTKNNREITAALVTEKKRLAEMEDEITRAKDSQLSLREKDEHIRDLTNEMKILQQHNNELIALSSKFSQAEIENIELRRKISEHLSDNNSLKYVVSSEQANQAALKAVNEQLMKKLEVLQKNMDNLTMQVVSFQNRDEKSVVSIGTQHVTRQADKKIGTIHEHETRIDNLDESSTLKKHERVGFEKSPRISDCNTNRGMRTANEKMDIRDFGQSNTENPMDQSQPSLKNFQNELQRDSDTVNSISRERMLKLLEQAQINTPLEAQNAARMRRIDSGIIGESGYARSSDSHRTPTPKQDILSCDFPEAVGTASLLSNEDPLRNSGPTNATDPNQILSLLYEILKSYSKNQARIVQDSTGNIERNNDDYHKVKNLTSIEDKCTETGDCSCTLSRTCGGTTTRGRGCCTPEANLAWKPTNVECTNVGTTIQEAFDSIHLARAMLQRGGINYGGNPEYFEPWQEIKANNAKDPPTLYKNLRITSRELQKCEKLLRLQYNLNGVVCKSKIENLSNENERSELLKMCQISDITKELECQKELIARLQKTMSAHCENVHRDADGAESSRLRDLALFPLIIAKDQGLVEMHVLSLQFSTEAEKILFKDDTNDLMMFVSWKIWGQKLALTPILKYPLLDFNSSSVYRISQLEKFFDCVIRKRIVFHVHVINENKNMFTVGRARLRIKDILDYSENKLHYVVPVFSSIPPSYHINFGQLSLWIRLSCDTGLLDNFKHKHGIETYTTSSKHHPSARPSIYRVEVTENATRIASETSANSSDKDVYDYRHGSPQASTISVIEGNVGHNPTRENDESGNVSRVPRIASKMSKVKHKSESDNIAAEKLKSMRRITLETRENDAGLSDNSDESNQSYDEHGSSSDEESSDVPKKMDSGDQIESNSIAEFNRVLKNQTSTSLRSLDSRIDDLGSVISDEMWQKYKQRISNDTGSKKSDRLDGNKKDSAARTGFSPPTADTITINITSMTLFEQTSLMNNPDVQLLYVEYSFLGIRGAEMETVSLPKLPTSQQPMKYDFSRTFEVDEEHHRSRKNILSAMLSGQANPFIRFVIVSEPLPEETNIKECVEVGHAEINIREYALGDAINEIPLIIMNPSQSEQLGMLKIIINGIETMRRCMNTEDRVSSLKT